MAEGIANLGLQAVPLVGENHHKITRPIQNQYRKFRGDYVRPDPDIRDPRTMEEKGYSLRRRSQVGSDEEVVETVRHRGEVRGQRPGRPNNYRRSSSMNGGQGGNRGNDGGYESEGSVPPRGRVRAKSQGEGRKRDDSATSTSTSDLCSSTDEEKQAKKMQRKKWITAALASVATIHAAQKVYSSIEAHDKRIIEVQQGTMSPEEARKKQKSQRWQDAAAISIAALGIKGAISEWNEVSEEHNHHKEFLEKKEEHHKKRLEKQRRDRARERGGYYKGRDGYYYYDGPDLQDSQRSQLDGPKNGDRKMIEGPSRSRGRDGYDDDRRGYNNGRSRSRYDDDRRNSRRSSRYNYDDGQ